MKNIAISIFSAFLFILCSCSSKEASDLFKSVPKDSAFLAVVNVESISKKMESTNADFWQTISGVTQGKKLPKEINVLSDKNSGIDYSMPILIFDRKGTSVLTFMIKDESAFKECLKKEGIKLSSKDGIDTNSEHTVFISDKQGWFASDYPELSIDDIKLFKALDEESSMLSLQSVGELMEGKEDLACIISFVFLMENDLMASKSSLMLNMLFDTPRYIEAKFNFNTGNLEGVFSVLNDKGATSSCSIKPAKINIAALKEFQAKGEVFFAIGTDSQLMEMIASQLRNFPVLPPEALDALKNIDGNIVFATSAEHYEDRDPNVSMQITFNSPLAAENGRELVDDILGGTEDLQVSVAGKSLSFSAGAPSEGSSIGSVAAQFDGASLGTVALPSFLEKTVDPSVASVIKGFSLMGKVDGDNLQFHLTLNTTPGQNSLVALSKLNGN